jgi:hypothetical protein
VVIAASPRCCGLSAAVPASNAKAIWVTGTAVRCAYSIGIPFDSFAWTISGNSSVASWPTGGIWRSPLTAPSVFDSSDFGGSTAFASW